MAVFGSFSLNPGPATPEVTPGTLAGIPAAGIVTPQAFVQINAISGDVASIIEKAPLAIIYQAYARAARELCRRTMMLTRTVVPYLTQANQPIYNLGADANFEILGLKAGQIQQLSPNQSWVDLWTNTDAANFDPNRQPSLPTYVNYIPEGMVNFYPIPNNAYPVQLEVYVQTPDNATQIPLDLYRKYNRYIEAGALAHLYGLSDEPWYNPIERDRNKAVFEEGFGQGRSDIARGKQAGSLRAKPRAFLAR